MKIYIKEFRNHLYFGQNTIKDGREDRRGFRLSILDKETLKFRIVVIYNPKIEKNTSGIVEGTCDKVN